MPHGRPVSYLVLAAGTPVLSRDGRPVGKVEHVLADREVDVFDGVIVRMRSGGWRFADAGQVAELHENGMLLTLDATAAERLPEPSENPPAMRAGPDATTPDRLDDKLRRAWDWTSGNY